MVLGSLILYIKVYPLVIASYSQFGILLSQRGIFPTDFCLQVIPKDCIAIELAKIS
jgi:hypothetical protein